MDKVKMAEEKWTEFFKLRKLHDKDEEWSSEVVLKVNRQKYLDAWHNPRIVR